MMNETGSYPGQVVAVALHALVPDQAVLDLRNADVLVMTMMGVLSLAFILSRSSRACATSRAGSPLPADLARPLQGLRGLKHSDPT